MLPSSVGPYRVVRLLGSGGMGEVWLADDSRLGRKVALKKLPDATPAGTRHLLMHEARAAAVLNHPHIAGVYDVLESETGTCIVMEYIDGDTLSTRLGRGPLPVPAVLHIAAELLDALEHAHGHGIVHRDLKPANIQITTDGRAKILDFGVARIQSSGESRRAPGGATTRVVGTPGYAAPEQLAGLPGDARSDLYGLGMLLFEALTGRRPFMAPDLLGATLQAVSRPAPSPGAFNPTISPEVSAIVVRALEPDPARRYQSASEMLSDVRRAARLLADGATVDQVSGPRARVRVRRMADWRPLVVGVSILTVLLGIVAAIAVGFRDDRASPVAASSRPVVAVLPLNNLSGDESDYPVSLGVSEAISTRLARVPAIAVISRSDLRDVRGTAGGIEEVARAVGATFVVDGSLQRAGDVFGVNLRLVAADGTFTWGERFEGSAADLFMLQSRMAEAIVNALHVRVSAAERQRLDDTPRADPQALVDYWQGRALLDRLDVPSNVPLAIDAFRSAVDRDAAFAMAHAGLCEAYWQQYRTSREAQWTTLAIDACATAVDLERDNTVVRVALAAVQRGTGRLDAAASELRHVMELQPNHPDAPRLLGQVLAEQGQIDAAIPEFQQAIALRPQFWINYSSLGVALFEAGRYRDAIPAFEQVVALQPDSAWGHNQLGAAFHMLGERQLAREHYERAIELGPNARALSNLGTIYYHEGRFADAARTYEEALGLNPTSPTTNRNLGDAYQRLGNLAAAKAAWLRALDLTRAELQVNPTDAENLSRLAVYEAKLGRHDEAEQHAAQAVASLPESGAVHFRQAVVYALAGASDRALASLTGAMARGYSASVARSDHDLDALRQLPQFEQIVGPAAGEAAR